MKLAVTERGRGRPVLLVPGWGMSAALLTDWADALGDFRVQLVDLPGQGQSPDQAYTSEQLSEALVQLAPPDALWVGWSLGVPVLLQAALRRPPVGMFLVAGTPRFLRARSWPGVQAAALDDMRERLASEPVAVWRQFLALLGQATPEDRRLARELLRRQPEPGEPRGLASGLRLLAEADVRDALGGLGCPALWLGGSRDPLVPAPSLARAAAACPRGRLQLIETAGHLPFWSHGEDCAQALRALMEWTEQ